MKKIFPDSLPKNVNGSHYYLKDFFVDNNNNKNIVSFYHDSKFGFPITSHTHDFYEINIVMHGRGVHYINNGKVLTSSGDIFIIRPKTEHGYYELNDMSIFTILINDKFFDDYNDKLKKLSGYMALFYFEPQMRTRQVKNAFLQLNHDSFNKIIKKINELTEYNNDDRYSNMIKDAIVFEMICLFCYYYNNVSVYSRPKAKSFDCSKSERERVVLKIIEYMDKNISEKITIEEIAKKSHYNIVTIERYFKEIMKQSPLQYLQYLRIEKAKELLSYTKLSLVDISLQCGFFDSSHFIKYFTKTQKMLPSQYRSLTAKT